MKVEKNKVVIWGAGGWAAVVANILKFQKSFEIIGFLDDVNPETKGNTVCGKPVMGGREQLEILRDLGVNHIVMGLGNCAARLRLGDIIAKHGYSVPILVHPRAVITPGSEISEGTIIHAGALLGPGSRVGKYCIINAGSTISHDCIIENSAHVCPSVSIGGNTKVGQGSWIGIGSTVIQKIRIGKGSYIGAGSVVVEDIPDGVLAYGNPARVIRPITHLF